MHPYLYKGRKRSPMGIVLTLVTSVMLILVFSFVLFEVGAEKDHLSHSYNVDIEASNEEYYLIQCPIPVNADGKLRRGFADEVNVASGDVEIDIISTEHGRALRIVGHGPANVTWDDRWDGDRDEALRNLSMPYVKDGSPSNSTWMYCNQGGVTIHIRSYSAQSRLDPMPAGLIVNRTIEGEMTSAGWQLMPVSSKYFALI